MGSAEGPPPDLSAVTPLLVRNGTGRAAGDWYQGQTPYWFLYPLPGTPVARVRWASPMRIELVMPIKCLPYRQAGVLIDDRAADWPAHTQVSSLDGRSAH